MTKEMNGINEIIICSEEDNKMLIKEGEIVNNFREIKLKQINSSKKKIYRFSLISATENEN